MDLLTAIMLDEELTDLVITQRGATPEHWKNFGFSHGWSILKTNTIDIYSYHIVSTGKKGTMDYMDRITMIINKYANPSLGWHIDFEIGRLHITIP